MIIHPIRDFADSGKLSLIYLPGNASFKSMFTSWTTSKMQNSLKISIKLAFFDWKGLYENK